MNISKCVNRVNDGYYRLISPSDFLAWLQLTRTVVYPTEYVILCEMDRMFCEEANKELEDIRSQEQQSRR